MMSILSGRFVNSDQVAVPVIHSIAFRRATPQLFGYGRRSPSHVNSATLGGNARRSTGLAMLLLMNLIEPGREIVDEEGVDLPDLESARKAAMSAAQCILSTEVRAGIPLHLNRRIEVTDAKGQMLLTVKFSDAIQIVA